MCGIFGFNSGDSSILARMCFSIKHRGPDAEYFWHNSEMRLGMCRLSIVDISSSQPVFNEDKTVVSVINGEIYNYIELKKDLENLGHKFIYDHSDVELIPHLYEEYGVSWPKYVNGMFAVSLYDIKQKKLYLFRDRVGKKPLYYFYSNKNFAFSSEIKALLEYPPVSKEIDYGSLCTYLAKKTTEYPNTIYKSIKQVPPGHYLVWDGSNIIIQRYWDILSTSKSTDISPERFLSILKDSVELRTRCDVPFGAYLSGGIDSSSVVSILSGLGRKVKTFCLGYDSKTLSLAYGKNEDLENAKYLSKIFGTDHYEIIITPEEFKQHMVSIINAFDEPFSGTVSNYFVSSLIKNHVKVALSGDGADELFGSYLAHRLAPHISFLLKTAPQLVYNGEQWRKGLFVFGEEDAFRLLKKDIYMGYTPAVMLWDNDSDMINSVLLEDQLDLLPNQVLPFVDRLSMAHSVEVRCPYLDYRLIEFVNSIPGNYKVFWDNTKIFQKEALLRLLPEKIITRKKEGFVQPIYTWMNLELSAWIDELLAALPEEIFNYTYIKTLDKTTDKAKIWNLACFSLWWNSRGF